MTESRDESPDSFVLIDHDESLLPDVPSTELSTNSLTSLERSSVVKSWKTEECPDLNVDNKTIIENYDGINENMFNQDCQGNLKLAHKIYNNFEIIEPLGSMLLKSIDDNEVFEGDLSTCIDDIVISNNNFPKSLDVIDEMDFRVNILNRDTEDATWTPNLYIHKDNEVQSKDISNFELDKNQIASTNVSDNKLDYFETYDNATDECKYKESGCKEIDIDVKNTSIDLCLSPDIDKIIDFKINDNSLYKSDDVDFRLNILNENELEDSSTPNLLIDTEVKNKIAEVILNNEDDKNESHNELTINTNINIDGDSKMVDCHTVLSQGEIKLDGVYLNAPCLPISIDSLVCFSDFEKSMVNVNETSVRIALTDNNTLASEDNFVRTDKMDNDTDHTLSFRQVINNDNGTVHGRNSPQLLQDLSLQPEIIKYVEDEAKIIRIPFNLPDPDIGNKSSVHNIDEVIINNALADNNVAESDDNYFSTDEMDNDIGHALSVTQVINNYNEAVYGTNVTQLLPDIYSQPQIINSVGDEAKIVRTPNDLLDITIVHESSTIPKPIGIRNPTNFKSMNSVLGMLFNCFEFRAEMINYHRKDKIANIDFDMLSDITANDACFVNDLCRLFTLLTEEKGKFQRVARSIRNYILNDHFVDLDVYQGFQYILWKINAITKTVINEPIASTKQEDIDFDKYKFENHGFISDLFYGQIVHKIVCENCNFIHSENYQPINSISLNIQELESSYNFDDCIKSYFKPTFGEPNDNYHCCVQPIIKIFHEITHAPEYFFIYLDRKLENGKVDDRYFETDNGFFIQTKNGVVLYSLISVIDQDVANQYNHNVKCFTDHWWMVDDYSARKIFEFEIVLKSSVGFMLKRINEN